MARFRYFSWLAVLLIVPIASAQQPSVLKLILHDTIQPVSAGYLQRGLQQAASEHAAAVLISLGTPGGLLDSTREIVSAINASPVPVIVYIAPSGSRAGSAGFFILEAADVAAMAPGTNAGAAHPIVEGQSSDKMDPILKQKIENDALAFLRSYTARRGRDVQAATDAVAQSKSYSDSEALQLKLIDVIAPNDATLLATLNGRTIARFDGSHTTLNFSNARIETLPPSLRERLLGRLVNPDFAVLILILGGLLIYLEFHVPGTVVPGAVGTLLVLLSLFALNLLPIRHAAILLLIAAVVLILIELKIPSHGALALAGITSLVFGLLLLVDGPIPELRVHLGVALGLGAGFGMITFGLAFLAVKAKRNKLLLGPQALVGGTAIVRRPLDPTGQVEIRGELWQATLTAPHLAAGLHVPVKVRGVQGLTLLVEPLPPE